jgi:hypothetical protein
MQAIEQQGIEVLAPPDGKMREGKRPGWEHERYEQMREKLTSERGRKLTPSGRSRSSRCSGRSNTTATSTGSCEEAGPPPGQSGG